MLVTENKYQDKDGSVGYYEAIFKSSNILKTTYFPKDQRLYISFNRGGVYSYEYISFELYKDFLNSESHGEFFAREIQKHKELYPYRKEFTLYPEEVRDLKKIVDNFDEDIEPDNNFIEINEDSFGKIIKPIESDSNSIIFHVDGIEYVKINEDGFFWMGKLVEEDKEIYNKFKIVVDAMYNNLM